MKHSGHGANNSTTTTTIAGPATRTRTKNISNDNSGNKNSSSNRKNNRSSNRNKTAGTKATRTVGKTPPTTAGTIATTTTATTKTTSTRFIIIKTVPSLLIVYLKYFIDKPKQRHQYTANDPLPNHLQFRDISRMQMTSVSTGNDNDAISRLNKAHHTSTLAS